MKYSEIIKTVDSLYPNEYSEEEKLLWIGQVNSDILKNIEKTASPGAFVRKDAMSLVPSPYDDIYIYYILSKICYFQKDFESYERHTKDYYQKRSAYLAYFIRTNGSDWTTFKNYM